MPRASSTVSSLQLCTPPCVFHASFGHVSAPNSPVCGMLWKIQRTCAGADVVGLHVAGRRLVAGPLRRERDDVGVLEDAARVAGLQRQEASDVVAVGGERGAQVHAAAGAEGRHGLAGAGVDLR